MWEAAGQPEGADFSNDARASLQTQLDQGATVEHLERSLKAPSPKQPEPTPKQEEATAQPVAEKEAPSRAPPQMPNEQTTEVGWKSGVVKRSDTESGRERRGVGV